jgi:AbrB family looped-hinge helix DNA binding protein
MEFEIAKLGERGQVVIPQSFRDGMGMHKGEKFMVLQRGDMLVLKRLRAPSKQDFENMLQKGHKHAQKNNLTEQDMWDAINKVRK